MVTGYRSTVEHETLHSCQEDPCACPGSWMRKSQLARSSTGSRNRYRNPASVHNESAKGAADHGFAERWSSQRTSSPAYEADRNPRQSEPRRAAAKPVRISRCWRLRARLLAMKPNTASERSVRKETAGNRRTADRRASCFLARAIPALEFGASGNSTNKSIKADRSRFQPIQPGSSRRGSRPIGSGCPSHHVAPGRGTKTAARTPPTQGVWSIHGRRPGMRRTTTGRTKKTISSSPCTARRYALELAHRQKV